MNKEEVLKKMEEAGVFLEVDGNSVYLLGYMNRKICDVNRALFEGLKLEGLIVCTSPKQASVYHWFLKSMVSEPERKIEPLMDSAIWKEWMGAYKKVYRKDIGWSVDLQVYTTVYVLAELDGVFMLNKFLALCDCGEWRWMGETHCAGNEMEVLKWVLENRLNH